MPKPFSPDEVLTFLTLKGTSIDPNVLQDLDGTRKTVKVLSDGDVTITAKYIETGRTWATWQIVMQPDSDEPKSGTLSSFAHDEKALITFVHGESGEYGWCLFR